MIMSSCLSQMGREYLWRSSCLGWDEEALQLLSVALSKYPLQESPRSCSHFCVVRCYDEHNTGENTPLSVELSVCKQEGGLQLPAISHYLLIKKLMASPSGLGPHQQS